MNDYLDENVAHTIANVMLAVLQETRRQGNLCDDFESLMPLLEKGLCNAIESHIIDYGEDEFVRGEESAWRDGDDR